MLRLDEAMYIRCKISKEMKGQFSFIEKKNTNSLKLIEIWQLSIWVRTFNNWRRKIFRFVRKYLRQKYFLLIMHVRQVHNDNELDYFWQCSSRNNGWNVSCLCNNTLINDMPQFMFKSPQISVLFCPNDAWSWITTCLALQHNTGTWNNYHLSERSLE